jgi:hypothetical protein
MAVLLLAVAGQNDATPTPPAQVQEPLPEASAPAPKAQAPEVYRLRLAADIPIIVAGVGAGLARVLFKDKLARKSCPCDSASINRLDRWTVGYHSQAASVAADVTVYGVLIALPFVDLLDVGFGRALGEDVVVYVEALAVSTAIQNATNFITARPRPRSYAGDPAMANSGEGYLSFYAGHVSTVSAGLAVVALTIRKRYGEQVWPWIVGRADHQQRRCRARRFRPSFSNRRRCRRRGRHRCRLRHPMASLPKRKDLRPDRPRRNERPGARGRLLKGGRREQENSRCRHQPERRQEHAQGRS